MADYYSQGPSARRPRRPRAAPARVVPVLIEGAGCPPDPLQVGTGKLNITPARLQGRHLQVPSSSPTPGRNVPESKDANQRWLDQLWAILCGRRGGSSGRSSRMPSPNKDHFLEQLRKAGGNAASYALDNGLVDQPATRDEMTQAVIMKWARPMITAGRAWPESIWPPSRSSTPERRGMR